MTDTPGSTPSGWYPDPFGRHEHRWFNGTSWTSDVADAGQRFVDPMGLAPGGPAAYPERRPTNGIATAAMTCGIIAVVLAWIPFIVFAGIVLAVLALVFGTKGLGRAKTADRGRGFAIAGLVTGTAALLVSILGIVFTVRVWNEAVDFIEPGRHDVEITECLTDGRDVTIRGELTNRSDDRRGYTVFASMQERSEFATLDDVDPGETVEWLIELRTRSIPDECDPVVTVNGPLPFGFEMEPVDS